MAENELRERAREWLLERKEFVRSPLRHRIATLIAAFASLIRKEAMEECAGMLTGMAESHKEAHQDKSKGEWQRDTEWNKYIRYTEAAAAIREQMEKEGLK